VLISAAYGATTEQELGKLRAYEEQGVSPIKIIHWLRPEKE
jgi:hypothetical protein